MDENFKNSRTYQNLAKAFAGECQAGARYQFTSAKATAAKLEALAQKLKVLAKNEMAHARVFFNFITNNGKDRVDNIDIKSGYPYKCGELWQELAFSAENEFDEAENIYPGFAKTAEKEGYNDIAAQFTRIAAVETQHQAQLEELSQLLNTGLMYSKPEETMWKCSECGYESTSKNAWKICPLCKYAQGYAEIPMESAQ